MHEAQILVLVLSADSPRAKRVQELLLDLHCQAHTVVSGAEESAVLLSNVRFDLAVLDWEPADADALELYGEIGKRGIPRLVLHPPSAAPQTLLADGFDSKMEWLSEPLDTETIRAALQKLLGGTFPGERPRHVRLGDFVFDTVTYDASWKGRAIKLPPVEFRLLQLFLRHEGKPLARQFIFESVWPDGGYEMGRMVDVHVSNLRRALAQTVRGAKIHTIKGYGYSLTLGSRVGRPVRAKARRRDNAAP